MPLLTPPACSMRPGHTSARCRQRVGCRRWAGGGGSDGGGVVEVGDDGEELVGVGGADAGGHEHPLEVVHVGSGERLAAADLGHHVRRRQEFWGVSPSRARCCRAMTTQPAALERARDRVRAIQESGVTIYDPLLTTRQDLFLPDQELEVLLDTRLYGSVVAGPIRTRSKTAKSIVAEALGYPVPKAFSRTEPRFPGQNLDVRVQANDNLQIWNQNISPERRYVLIRPDSGGIVRTVRVIRGRQIAKWDRTGTLTSKYQARRLGGSTGSRLVSPLDTDRLLQALQPRDVPEEILGAQDSGESPIPQHVLTITEIYRRASGLVGARLPAVGVQQDRVRGEQLQEVVTKALGLARHNNQSQWPDVVSQALEVKLQTSPTVDLGLVLPSDPDPAPALGPAIRHCDATLPDCVWQDRSLRRN